MEINKAVITAASKHQRTLPLQSLVDCDGKSKSVLKIIVSEARRAGVQDICVVISPGDKSAYQDAAGSGSGDLCFIEQKMPLGYAHALHCARDFVGAEPFLHMVGDHVYISENERGCAEQLVAVAKARECSVSAVQPTREGLLPLFGAIGGHRLRGTSDLFRVEKVIEKPTPTEAEQSLLVAGLRAGHYLCFFGMHVFSPTVMEILDSGGTDNGSDEISTLSDVLHAMSSREQYLAVEVKGRRYPVDVPYGLLTAQLALALNGREQDEVLSLICELLAQRRPASGQPLSVVPGS